MKTLPTAFMIAGLASLLATSVAHAACVNAHGDFVWSCAGPRAGMACVKIEEPSEPSRYTWNDNYFCSQKDMGLRWSYRGPIAGLRCVQTFEDSAQSRSWADNYLCLPHESELHFKWSSGGAIPGLECVKWEEPSSPQLDTWGDNYLCWSSPPQPPPPRRNVAHSGDCGILRTNDRCTASCAADETPVAECVSCGVLCETSKCECRPGPPPTTPPRVVDSCRVEGRPVACAGAGLWDGYDIGCAVECLDGYRAKCDSPTCVGNRFTNSFCRCTSP